MGEGGKFRGRCGNAKGMSTNCGIRRKVSLRGLDKKGSKFKGVEVQRRGV